MPVRGFYDRYRAIRQSGIKVSVTVIPANRLTTSIDGSSSFVSYLSVIDNYRPLAGSVVGYGSVSGNLQNTVRVNLSGSVVGSGQAYGNITNGSVATVSLSGSVTGGSVLSSTMSTKANLSGASAGSGSLTGTISNVSYNTLSGSVNGVGATSGTLTNSSGGSRLYTLNDASTPPIVWKDMQSTSSVTYDGTTKRISSIANRGTAGGSFTPTTTATAPLYNAIGFNATYPSATFNSADPDMLYIPLATINQPATAVYVWQEGSSVKAYEVFVDHDTNISGNRQTLFSAYGGNTPLYMIRTVSGSETQTNLLTSNQAANKINVLVVEFNGTSSRIYYNGVQSTGFNLGAVLSNTGLAVGGKKGDSATYFGGASGEVAILPAVFTGDAWDRITQGTMWKWGQQANIAAGATYKSAAPTVPA